MSKDESCEYSHKITSEHYVAQVEYVCVFSYAWLFLRSGYGSLCKTVFTVKFHVVLLSRQRGDKKVETKTSQKEKKIKTNYLHAVTDS